MDEDQSISTRLGVAATAGSKRRYARLGLWHRECATGLMEEAERVVVLSCFVSSCYFRKFDNDVNVCLSLSREVAFVLELCKRQ